MAKYPKWTDLDTTEWPGEDAELETALRLEVVPCESSSADPPAEPSRRLLLATLADAVVTFRRTAPLASREDAHDFAQAVRWFASDETSDPLGFIPICRALGLDPAALREGLKDVRRRARTAGRQRILH
jgi:hypothetical protein